MSVEAEGVLELRPLEAVDACLDVPFQGPLGTPPSTPTKSWEVSQPQPMINSTASPKACESHAVRVTTKFLEAPLQSSGALFGESVEHSAGPL